MGATNGTSLRFALRVSPSAAGEYDGNRGFRLLATLLMRCALTPICLGAKREAVRPLADCDAVDSAERERESHPLEPATRQSAP